MLSDSLSPFAPTRVRILVLPAGHIKRSRFLQFYSSLQSANVVKLQDFPEDDEITNGHITSTSASWRIGMVFYDYTLSASQQSHINLTPFELFREPLIVIGIADAREYGLGSTDITGAVKPPMPSREELQSLPEVLREQYPRVLMHKVFVFDEPDVESEINLEQDTTLIPYQDDKLSTILQRVIHNLTVDLRRELSSYAKSVSELPSISSPNVPQIGPPQGQSNGDEVSGTLRRDSNYGDRNSAGSPVRDQKELHRMSMPVISSNTNFSDARPESPGVRKPPAKTFEEISTGDRTLMSPNPIDRLRSRPGSAISSRDGSKDRVSVHGFGSDSFSEKNRNKGRGRVGVVLSSVYLMAGRWEDALKQSIDSAIKARSFSDHVWHAKALEHTAISMVLLAWTGYEFQIPSICYSQVELPAGEKPATVEAEVKNEINLKPFASRQAQATMMKMLTSIMLSMTNMVQSIYGRALSPISGDAVPHIVYADCTVRLSKLLAMINLCGGVLTELGISHLLIATPITIEADLSLSRIRMHPSRREITNIVNRALPTAQERALLSPVDNALVLSGVASVYSLMGMQRKKAMIMKEFLSTVVPSLIQAKIAGAAEAGIHPSAAIAALSRATDVPEWDLESGIEDFLNVICHVYGIPEAKWTQFLGSELMNGSAPKEGATKAQQLPEQLVGNFILRSFGNPMIKADILRACISLCEALPDYHGILHYSSTLLRTAGPGIAPNAETNDILVSLPQEEQIQLANNILKTVNTAKEAGYQNIEAEYWDEFLIRGFYLLDSTSLLTLRPHRKSTLGKIKSETVKKRDPFIHNPFLEKTGPAAVVNLLAAGEEREFIVSLQNPYEFEVEIQYLQLAADGVGLDISKQDFVLRPYRTQSISLTGTISTPGTINITGCIVKVKGCRERLFPIFNEPWTPESDTRIKNIGLIKSTRQASKISDHSRGSSGVQTLKRSFPIPSTIPLQVIPQQPDLIIIKSSAPQNSLMLLEGERTTITLTIHNSSSTIAADFLHISFKDTASDVMQDAMSHKGIPPSDMYEIEYQLTNLPAIAVTENQPTSIPPRQSVDFTFNILAKAGLTTATIQFDYANVSNSPANAGESFYTRQVVYPLSVTVNASIVVHRLEIVPLSGDFAWHLAANNSHNESGRAQNKPQQFHGMTNALKLTSKYEEHCLLLLDLRNNWPSPIRASVRYDPESTVKSSSGEDEEVLFNASESIQPGQVARQIILVPKVYIAEPHRRITSLSPAHQRQFVVSTDRIIPDAERAIRECFWFREALLDRLSGTWSVEGDVARQTGFIDLRGIRLSTRMVDTLRLSDIGVSFAAEGESIKQFGRAKFEAAVDKFFTVRAIVRNRSTKRIFPLLRLRPGLADQPREIALEVGKRFAWSGVLQRPLPAMLPGEERKVDLPARALCAGDFEISASIQEIKAAEIIETEDSQEQILDDLIASTGRRTWTAAEPCRIVAVAHEELP